MLHLHWFDCNCIIYLVFQTKLFPMMQWWVPMLMSYVCVQDQHEWVLQNGSGWNYPDEIFIAVCIHIHQCFSQKILLEGQSGPWKLLLGAIFLGKEPINYKTTILRYTWCSQWSRVCNAFYLGRLQTQSAIKTFLLNFVSKNEMLVALVTVSVAILIPGMAF